MEVGDKDSVEIDKYTKSTDTEEDKAQIGNIYKNLTVKIFLSR